MESKRCEQCGREGTRGFKVIEPFPLPEGYEGQTEPYITCASLTACRKRWVATRDSELA
jgi:hypothetical protein